LGMTAAEAFRVGVVHYCVEHGIPAEKIAAVVDQAETLAKRGTFSDLAGLAAKGGLGTAALIGGGLLAAPPALGYLAGRTVGGMDTVENSDVDEVKERETLRAIQDETENLNQEKQIRDYQQHLRKPPIRFRV
jgi:enoyl-CoA hydratase/carnithine racemase